MLSFIILEAFNRQQIADHFDRNKSIYYGALGLLAGGLGTKYWLNQYNNYNKVPSPKTESIIDLPKTQGAPITTPATQTKTDFALPPEEEPSRMPSDPIPKIPSVINSGSNDMNGIIDRDSSIPGTEPPVTSNMG